MNRIINLNGVMVELSRVKAIIHSDFTKSNSLKIELNKRGKVRRARIYYFRELTGKKARIKEAKR